MDMRYYEVMQNSDQTEGRGPMKLVGNHYKLEAAIQDAKGRGVMGYGDGEVIEVSITVNNDDTITVERHKVYGYRQGRDGKWGYGYMDLRDEPDPRTNAEYANYLRLRKKFEGK